MSKETIEWLGANSLIGNTDERGNAWHWREGNDNHFPGPVPRERVVQLFSYPVAEGGAAAVVPVMDENGVESKVFIADDHKSIVRLDTGKVFHFPKLTYALHTPQEWCLEALERLMDDGLVIGSAIVLQEGKVAAIQVEMPETRIAEAGRGAEPVKHRPFMTAATSLDASMSTTYCRGTKVWVCDNTLSTALNTADATYKVQHRRGSLTRVGEIRERLGLVVEQIGDAFDAQVRALTEQYVSDQKFYEIVDGFAGVNTAKEGRGKTIAQSKAAALSTLWNRDERVAPWKNNAYGVVAAFNTYQHHVFGADKNRIERNELRTLQGKWDSFDANVLQLLASV